MTIKDKVVSLYIKHYLMPRAQIIDKPGFIIFNVTGNTPLFARQIIVPEIFFTLLETNMQEKLGNKGKRILYSVGKKFGTRFSLMGNFSKKGEMPDKKLPDYINMINKFIEGTYATNISCDIDIKNLKIVYNLENFVICNKIGKSFFLPLGAAAGLVSYLLNDKTIEGAYLKSKGKKSKLVYTLYSKLKEIVKDEPIFEETYLDDLDFSSEYQSMNSIRNVESSNYSFQQFIGSNIFSFKEGIILNGDQRYFIYEVSGIYLLEREMQKNENTKKILYDVAFESGKKMILNYSKDPANLEVIIDLLVSFGWGDVSIFEKKSKYIAKIRYFPWTKFFEEVDFIVFRGIVAGMLSTISKRTVKFNNVEKDVSQGFLSLGFFE